MREVTMQYTIMLWHVDHVNFARLLNLLEGEVDLLHDAGSPHYQLMLDIMYYMTHYSAVLHHPKEDLVFARLNARDENGGGMLRKEQLSHPQLGAMGAAIVRAHRHVKHGSIRSGQ